MKKFLLPALASGLLLLQMSAARAVTFAQFVRGTTSGGTTPAVFELIGQNDSNDMPASILQSNGTGTAGSFGTIPVVFYFQQPSDTPTLQKTPFGVAIDGTLSLMAHASDAAAAVGSQEVQDFNNITMSITVSNTANNTALGLKPGSVLLAATSGMNGDLIGGTLSGTEGGKSATFSGTDVTQGSPLFFNTVAFSSDYIDFTSASNKAYAYSYSNVIPFYSMYNSGPNAPFDDYIMSFLTDGSGTFSSNFAPVVPEPGSLALFAGLGMSGALLGLKRRRSRRA